MKTKNIFHTLALVMLTPTMLLTSACSNSDELATDEIPTVNSPEKGYSLPVTVTVTRQGDAAATRAVYDETDKKLEFSTGDQLFVTGSEKTAGKFAGLLMWQSGGTFSGELKTQNLYTGTADELLSHADYCPATLIPNGYSTYGFFTIAKADSYDAELTPDYNNAYAPTKKEAVEQLSYEFFGGYSSSGFTLIPMSAILSFTIDGFYKNEDVDMSISYTNLGNYSIEKTITADASGVATFAVGVLSGTNRADCSITVTGQNSGRISSIGFDGSKESFMRGHIYNISRTAASVYPLLSVATASDHGKVVCNYGHLHPAKTAVPTGCTAVGILGTVTSTGHGLILALQDAPYQDWETIDGWTPVTTYAGTTLKVLPDDAARGANLTSYTTLGATPVSNWAVAQKSDYEAIFQNLGSTQHDSDGYTYDANVNAYITTGVDGTELFIDLVDYTYISYWSATADDSYGWFFNSDCWNKAGKSITYRFRPVLAF